MREEEREKTKKSRRGMNKLTLKQTCYRESPAAPFAFKDSMIH